MIIAMITIIMDLVDGMRAFSQVVATGSFTAAGDRLGLSNKLVSKYVAQLEEHLGTRLLNRTTRSQSLTEAGALYYDRCVELLGDLEALESTIRSQVDHVRGRLLITAPTTFGELHVAPLIVPFLAAYPDVVVDLRLTDRYVNLVDEGFDLAIRIGALESSALIARKISNARAVLCASPDYLAAAPVLTHPQELSRHRCIADLNFRNGASWPFHIDGHRSDITITPALSVNSAAAARVFALEGGGVVLSPSYVVGPDLRSGALVEVLAAFTRIDLPVHAVYNSARLVAPKVRAFVDFLST